MEEEAGWGKWGGIERRDEEKETQTRGNEGNVGRKEANLRMNGKEGKETRKRKLMKEGSGLLKMLHGKPPGGEKKTDPSRLSSTTFLFLD